MKKPTTTGRALLLLARRPMTAGELGNELWRTAMRRGRIASASGGGDYAAQMLLGRLRKAGLARTKYAGPGWAGCSVWELTEAGVKAAVRAVLDGGQSSASISARAEIEGRTPEPRMPVLRRCGLGLARSKRGPCDCGGTPPCSHT